MIGKSFFVVYDISGVTENGSPIFQYSGLFIVCHCLWAGCSWQVLSCHFLIPALLLCLALSVWKKKTGWQKCAGGICLTGTLQELDFSHNICACVAPALKVGQLSVQNRACRNLADYVWHTLIQAQVQIIRLSAAPVAHSEMFGKGPDSVSVKTAAKKEAEWICHIDCTWPLDH